MKKILLVMVAFIMVFTSVCTSEILEVKAADALTSYMKQSHPRLFVTDFEPIREKIATDGLTAEMFRGMVRICDELVADPKPIPHDVEKLKQAASGTLRRIMSTNGEVDSKFAGLAFVAAITGEQKYLDRLWIEIEHMGTLPNWNTAHWLEPAEIIQAHAIAYDWCYDMWTEEQRTTIRENVKRYVLDYTDREYEGDPRWFKWHYGWDTEAEDLVGTNWTSVCNRGVMAASIAFFDDYPELCERLLNYSIRSIKAGVNEFHERGAYGEGIGYWSYAAEGVIGSAALLEAAFQGNFDQLPAIEAPFQYDFMKYRGVYEIADFATHLCGSSGKTVNHGDATAGSAASWVMFYLGNRMNRPDYIKYVTDIINPKAWKYSALDSACYYVIYYNPDIVPDFSKMENDVIFYNNIGSMRSSWEFGENSTFVNVNGSKNREPHQHWDVGTLTFDALGVRWGTQRGAGNYDWPSYMGSYNYYVRRPEGQNGILINPDHTPGQAVACETQVVKQQTGKDEGIMIWDFTEAYADNADRYWRGVKLFDNRQRLLVQDEITLTNDDSEVWWFLHNTADIKLSDNKKEALLSLGGQKLVARILSPSDASFWIKEAAPGFESPAPAVQGGTYGTKLAALVEGASGDITIAIELIPLPQDLAVPDDKPKVIPMENWTTDKEDVRLENASIGTIALLQDSSVAYVEGGKKAIDPDNFDIKPVIRNNRTMVPLRFVAESLGSKVSWNAETGEATVTYNYQDYVLKIGENFITMPDGTKKEFDSPSYIENERTYVPLRAISEAIGKHVYEDDGLILISAKENPYEDYPEFEDEIRDLLKYNMVVNGVSAKYFNLAHTDYNVFTDGDDEVTLMIAGQGDETKKGSEVSFDINGEKYTICFVENEYGADEPLLKEITVKCTEAENFIPEAGEGATHIPVKQVISSGDDGNIAANMVDNYKETRWSVNTNDGWAQFEFEEEREVTHMHAMWYAGSSRQEIFEIQTSLDSENWTTVCSSRGNGLTLDMQLFELVPTTAKYVRYVAKGNNKSSWNSVTEVRFYSSLEDAEKDAEDWFELDEPSSFQYITNDTYHITVEGLLENGEKVQFAPSDVVFAVSDVNKAYISEEGVLEVYEPGDFNVMAGITDEKNNVYRQNKVSIIAVE